MNKRPEVDLDQLECIIRNQVTRVADAYVHMTATSGMPDNAQLNREYDILDTLLGVHRRVLLYKSKP